jgi:hypothetical protein
VTNAAERQRRYRLRRDDGLIVLPAVVAEIDLTEMLIAEGFLTSDEPSREQLADALSKWLFQIVTRNNPARWPEL